MRALLPATVTEGEVTILCCCEDELCVSVITVRLAAWQCSKALQALFHLARTHTAAMQVPHEFAGATVVTHAVRCVSRIGSPPVLGSRFWDS